MGIEIRKHDNGWSLWGERGEFLVLNTDKTFQEGEFGDSIIGALPVSDKWEKAPPTVQRMGHLFYESGLRVGVADTKVNNNKFWYVMTDGNNSKSNRILHPRLTLSYKEEKPFEWNLYWYGK